MITFRSASRRHDQALLHPFSFGAAVCLAVAALVLFSTCVEAQIGTATINPISNFQVQEGSDSVNWSQTSASDDATSGNSVINFTDGNGGTATMVWLAGSTIQSGYSLTGTLVSWTITTPSGGTQAYTDGTARGLPGSFIQTSGVVGSNPIVTINWYAYAANGDILRPVQNAYATFFSFTFSGSSYAAISGGYDYSSRSVETFSDGCTLVYSDQAYLHFYFADQKYADYSIAPGDYCYTYQNDSTAANGLTAINGCSLLVSGSTVSLPLKITSYVLNGVTENPNWVYFPPGGGFQMNYSVQGFPANFDSGGNLIDLWVSDSNVSSEDIVPAGNLMGLPTYQVASSSGSGSIQLTGFNGIPYITQGSSIVPALSVSGFVYGGSTYQVSGFSQASDGNPLAQYSTRGSNPSTATLEYLATTGALVQLTVNPSSGGTATYVNGASVGQPGAYVWSSSSTAPNALTDVNAAT